MNQQFRPRSGLRHFRIRNPAFRPDVLPRAPALPEKTAYPEWDMMQPEWEQPQPAYESAVQESAFSQQSGAPAAVQEQPPAPRPQQNASAVQEAVVEILDD